MKEGEVYLVKDQLILFDLPNSKNAREIGLVKTIDKCSLSPVDIKNGLDAFLALKLQGWITTRSAKAREISVAFSNASEQPEIIDQQKPKDIIETNVCGNLLADMVKFLGQDSKLRLEIQVEAMPASFVDKPRSAVMTPKGKGKQVYYSAEYKLRQRATQRPTKTASWFWKWNTNTAARIPTTIRYSAIISLIVVCGQLENSKRIKLDHTIQTINEPENVRYSNKKLLQEKVATDTTIITGEGTKIECHKCFLIAHSAVFIPMLHGNFEEGRTHQIKMDDMSDRGARAFVNFLYCKDMNVPFDNPKIAVELLLVSHKYQITCLENAMKALLMVKPWEWFDIPSTIQLYFFAKNLDSLSQLSDKAFLILKLKRKELVLSEAFKELFEDEDKRGAARELCTSLISM